MSTANRYSPQTNVLPPRCPHCAGDLTQIGNYQWERQLANGVAIMLALYCPNAECRKLLQSQIMIVPAAQETGIVRPD